MFQGKKTVLFNIDDVGILSSVNQAAIQLLHQKLIKSVSVMMNGPWILDFIRMLHPALDVDVGIHLTLTSEWPGLRMRPLCGNTTPSLLDKQGYFHANTEELAEQATKDDVWSELSAQLMYAKQLQLKISHLDTHMLFYEAVDWLQDLLFDFAQNAKLPLLLYCDKSISSAQSRGIPCPDFGTLTNYWFSTGTRKESYRELIDTLSPSGITALTLHPGLLTPELIACMGENEALKRMEEFELFLQGTQDLGLKIVRPREVFQSCL